MDSLKVSVIIANYNYDSYVGRAIDSVLDQTRRADELIVVDDGSTDNSIAIIKGYGDQLCSLFTENRGQSAAIDSGLGLSSGDVVIFLDSDDLLNPEVIEMLVPKFLDRCVAKVQYDLGVIDSDGLNTGRRLCYFNGPVTSESVAKSFGATGTYTWPPTSGNAYARWFLSRVMPMSPPLSYDGVLNTLAPLYGKVETISQPLGQYRIHSTNLSRKNSAGAVRSVPDFALRVSIRKREFAVMVDHARKLGKVVPTVDFLDQELVFANYRIMARKWGSEDPDDAGRSIIDLWMRGMALAFKFGTLRGAITHFLWLTAVCIAPRSLARRMIELRYSRITWLGELRRFTRLSPHFAKASSFVGRRQFKMQSPLLSIIIANYNYERYVGAAIASALAVIWPNVEVIVVDDGSTDSSRTEIEKYAVAKRIYISNIGQAEAAIVGYSQCSGDWIIFLDSDDVLDPNVAIEAAKIVSPGWSKVQFQMQTIDGDGKPTGSVFPTYPKNTSWKNIRRWASLSDNYPTPPGSGNMVSRELMEKIVPLDHMDKFIDSYILSTAPFLGQVLTVAKPLVRYRVHGRNSGAQTRLDTGRLSRDLARHISRAAYATRKCQEYGVNITPGRWRHSYYNLAMRVVSLRLGRYQHPINGDTIGRCVGDLGAAFVRPQGLTAARHLAMGVWLLLVAASPVWLVRILASWRFAPTSRPRLLQRIIGVI